MAHNRKLISVTASCLLSDWRMYEEGGFVLSLVKEQLLSVFKVLVLLRAVKSQW